MNSKCIICIIYYIVYYLISNIFNNPPTLITPEKTFKEQMLNFISKFKQTSSIIFCTRASDIGATEFKIYVYFLSFVWVKNKVLSRICYSFSRFSQNIRDYLQSQNMTKLYGEFFWFIFSASQFSKNLLNSSKIFLEFPINYYAI